MFHIFKNDRYTVVEHIEVYNLLNEENEVDPDKCPSRPTFVARLIVIFSTPDFLIRMICHSYL